jgi:hypothetical protein
VSRHVWTLVVLAAVVFAARPASSQINGARYQPIFGAVVADPSVRQTLDVSFDVAEAYDDNLLGEAGVFSSSSHQVSGLYSEFAPQLNFQSHGQRAQGAVTATSNLRYYSRSGNTVLNSYSIGAGLNGHFSSRTTLSLNQSVTYSSSYLYGLFANLAPPRPGDVAPPAPDYALGSAAYHAYSTAIGFSRAITPRASVSATADFQYSDFSEGNPTYSDLRSYDAAGQYAYSLSRNTKMRVRYTYRHAEYSRRLRPTEHDVDIGVDYSKPLSATRRTSLGFSLGPRMVDTVGPGLGLAGGQIYRMVGDAYVNHPISRTWDAQASYRRGMNFLEGLPAPVFSDGITVTSSGFLNRRTDLLFGAAYAGSNSVVGAQSPLVSYTGNVRLRVALNRKWAAYAAYLFYKYDFSQQLLVPIGLPPHLTRNSVRVGVTAWVPVMRNH